MKNSDNRAGKKYIKEQIADLSASPTDAQIISSLRQQTVIVSQSVSQSVAVPIIPTISSAGLN